MIRARTAGQIRAIAALQFVVGIVVGCAFLLAYSPRGVMRLLRQFWTRLRRALKSAALWINAWLYRAIEDEIRFRASLKKFAAQSADNGRYLQLSAEQYRLRLRQRKLRAQRDRIHQW